jgi:hypothetical protein
MGFAKRPAAAVLRLAGAGQPTGRVPVGKRGCFGMRVGLQEGRRIVAAALGNTVGAGGSSTADIIT